MRLKYVCMYYLCNVYNVQVVEYAQFYINMQDNNKNEYSVCNNLSLRFHSRYFLFLAQCNACLINGTSAQMETKWS